jgi:hypothetical protein
VKITSDQKLDWPIALTKVNADTKRAGIFSERGFDGEYYLQLAEWYADKEKALKK